MRSASARRGRPKQEAPVTRAFLFSDLRDYTTFVEAHGDAAAARLIRDYRALVRREVARYAGAEVKTEGDSFYVVFDAPSAALECAVAILRRAAGRTAGVRESPLRIGIGLHIGEAVPHDDQYVGVAVNIAARLAGKADAGELLVSDALRAILRTAHRYAMSDRGPLRLKGVTERVRAWSVMWEGPPASNVTGLETSPPSPAPARPAPTAGQLLCPTLVGRDAELSDLNERLSRVASGIGEVVLLGGEAGVGKTAFVRQVQAFAREHGFRLLTGLSDESGAGLPYAPFVSAVRSAFRALPRERLARTLREIAPALAQLFPEFEREAIVEGAASRPERHRLSIAFQDLFLAFAREPPVLVVLEDLHWADEASLELLRYLARELRDARVLILGTYRSDELHRRHPLVRALADLQRERLATRVELRRLSRDEVGEMIRLTFRREEAISAEFLDAVYRRSEGNPFFTEELLRALVEQGDIYVTDGPWTRGEKTVDDMRIPDSIVEAVRARVERLSPDARRTLDAAAVVGLEFPFEVLQVVRAAEAPALERELREFIDLQLVSERARGADAYGFRHALTREVIYDDLLPSERRRLHGAVAEALAARPLFEPALLAHHLIAAGDAPRAVPHVVEAAARALRADAPREAAAHYARALEIGMAEDEVPRVLEQLAEAYSRFDLARCVKAAEEAAARYRHRSEPHGVSRALRLASRVLRSLEEGTRSAALAREAVDVVARLEPSVELARAEAHLAYTRILEGGYDDGRPIAERAIGLGERFEDNWTLANGLIAKGTAIRLSSPDEALALFLRARDLAIKADLPETAVRAYNGASLTMGVLRRPREERLAFMREGIAYGKRHGVEEMFHLPFVYGSTLYAGGEWDAALDVVKGYQSVNRVYLLGLQSTIVRAREGPRAALPLDLEAAERGVRAHFAWDFIVPVADAASACMLAGEDAEARAWLERLRARLDDDREASVHLATGHGGAVLEAALICDEPRLLELVESASASRTDPSATLRAAFIRAVRALLAGDTAGCARELKSLYAEEYEARDAGLATIFAREARRRGLALGSEWVEIVRRAREFAEHVGARWYLQELTAAMRAEPQDRS